MICSFNGKSQESRDDARRITHCVLSFPVIKSFKDRAVLALWQGERVREFEAFAKIARRKLDMLHAATALDELRAPPANHLEALKADRLGQHSIRINQRWRICFIWTSEGPANIEIVDYH